MCVANGFGFLLADLVLVVVVFGGLVGGYAVVGSYRLGHGRGGVCVVTMIRLLRRYQMSLCCMVSVDKEDSCEDMLEGSGVLRASVRARDNVWRSRLLSHDKRMLVMLVTGDILGGPVIQARSGGRNSPSQSQSPAMVAVFLLKRACEIRRARRDECLGWVSTQSVTWWLLGNVVGVT